MISARGDEKTKAEDEKTIRFGHGMISNSSIETKLHIFGDMLSSLSRLVPVAHLEEHSERNEAEKCEFN